MNGADGVSVSDQTADPSRRDVRVVETTGGFNDSGNLWRLVFVSYTDRALGTPEGQAVLADLAAGNGVDLDGTPVSPEVRREFDCLQGTGDFCKRSGSQ